MSILGVSIADYALPMRDSWPSAEGPIRVRRGAILILEEEDGRLGLGETAPWPGFGLESLASSKAALALAAKRLIGLPPDEYLKSASELPRLAPVAAAPCARHAIDLALHDLAARRAGISIARLLGGDAAVGEVSANAVIPRATAARSAALARQAIEAGAATIKLKVGGAPLSEDLARLLAVRAEIGAEARLRIDANQAWSENEAIEALSAMRPSDLEYCEQPVAAAAVESLARVRAAAGVAIAADESVRDLATARKILDAGAADVLIVKPMALGGLHAAHAIAMLARERGAEVVVTSLLESAVGRAGAAHLAASLGATQHAHGVAADQALERDLVDAAEGRRYRVPIADAPGLGLLLDLGPLAADTRPLAAAEP